MTNPWLESRDLPAILQRIHPHTMVPREALIELARQVRTVIEQSIPGQLVECGAWRGGASFLMAEILKHAGVTDRRVWLFDSFEGIQPPAAIDGPSASAWARDKSGPMYFDNLRVGVEDAQRNADTLGLSSHTRLVKGWFDETLPATREQIGPIALLRIDADWHASVLRCLEQLYDQVAEGGLIVLDDYYTWDGCAVAIHEFLGRRSLPHRLETIGTAQPVGAVLRKGTGTWHYLHQLHRVSQDIAEHVSARARLILVDDDVCRPLLHTDRPLLPFTEHDGFYNGPPADDDRALAELDRLKSVGATHLALAFPAFWWPGQYPRWWQHLQQYARPLTSNDRCHLFVL
jgi:hypothetical protein